MLNDYKSLFDEDIKLNELNQRLKDMNNKEENKEYNDLKAFIKDFPIEAYLNKKQN